MQNEQPDRISENSENQEALDQIAEAPAPQTSNTTQTSEDRTALNELATTAQYLYGAFLLAEKIGN